MNFLADEKFEEVITQLQQRQWKRETDEENIYSVGLLWMNLKQVDFDRVLPKVLVNHFQGSQHFSNKVSCSLRFQSIDLA